MRLALLLFFASLTCHAAVEVHKYTLDNGLKIVVKEDHRAPVAVTMVWYNIGSADEPGGITGVSHVLEHMMFKGTTKYGPGVFSKTIAALGGQDNAMTNYDHTAYYEKTAAVELPVALELEADRMQNLLLDPKEFEKEIKVVQEERRMRTDDNPEALTFERYLATAHIIEPYHHPVIGWMNDLKHMRLEDLKAWYQHFYAPNNATLVVIGDVNPDKVYELAKLYFGHIERKPDFVRKQQIEPPNLGNKTVQIHVPAKIPMLMFGYTVPSIKTAKEAYEPYALDIIANVLDSGESSRLTNNLVRGSQVASGTAVYYNMDMRYQTEFALFGTPSQSHSVAELKTALLKEVKRLQTEKVSNDELKRVKTQIIAQKTFEKDSLIGQAMEIGMLETIGLDSKTADAYVDNINQITPEQIQAVAKRYFREESMTEAQLFPVTKTKAKS